MEADVLNEEIELLEALPIFNDFNRDALKLLAFSADTRIMREGDILFHKNDLADAAYLLLSGTVRLDEAHVFERGTLLGQNALFAQVRRPSSAIMCESGAVLKITRLLMKRVLTTYPETAKKLRLRLNANVETIVSEVEIAIKNAARTVAGFN